MRITRFIATGFCSGYFPQAPGTAGSAVAIALLALLYWNFPQLADIEGRSIVALALTVIALLSAHRLWQHEFSKQDNDDPQIIVIDEFAGCAVGMLGTRLDVWGILFAFIAFRVFDILKPPPARQAERLHGGLGIVMDDVIAGIYAAICCWIFDLLR